MTRSITGIIGETPDPGLRRGESPNPLHRQQETWYFTFGIGHPLSGRYVRVRGTVESSRELICAIFGSNWSRQYARSVGEALARKHDLAELDLGLA